MSRKVIWGVLLALPLVGGILYTRAKAGAEQNQAAKYICPLTGEELPCPNCCPLNK